MSKGSILNGYILLLCLILPASFSLKVSVSPYTLRFYNTEKTLETLLHHLNHEFMETRDALGSILSIPGYPLRDIWEKASLQEPARITWPYMNDDRNRPVVFTVNKIRHQTAFLLPFISTLPAPQLYLNGALAVEAGDKMLLSVLSNSSTWNVCQMRDLKVRNAFTATFLSELCPTEHGLLIGRKYFPLDLRFKLLASNSGDNKHLFLLQSALLSYESCVGSSAAHGFLKYFDLFNPVQNHLFHFLYGDIAFYSVLRSSLPKIHGIPDINWEIKLLSLMLTIYSSLPQLQIAENTEYIYNEVDSLLNSRSLADAHPFVLETLYRRLVKFNWHFSFETHHSHASDNATTLRDLFPDKPSIWLSLQDSIARFIYPLRFTGAVQVTWLNYPKGISLEKFAFFFSHGADATSLMLLPFNLVPFRKQNAKLCSNVICMLIEMTAFLSDFLDSSGEPQASYSLPIFQIGSDHIWRAFALTLIYNLIYRGSPGFNLDLATLQSILAKDGEPEPFSPAHTVWSVLKKFNFHLHFSPCVLSSVQCAEARFQNKM